MAKRYMSVAAIYNSVEEKNNNKVSGVILKAANNHQKQ